METIWTPISTAHGSGTGTKRRAHYTIHISKKHKENNSLFQTNETLNSISQEQGKPWSLDNQLPSARVCLKLG
jgi:hypothetical protein